MAYKCSGTDQLYYSTFDGNTWSTSNKVEGARISTFPAAAADVGGRIVIAWKGVIENQAIFCNVFDGENWQAFDGANYVTAAPLSAHPAARTSNSPVMT